METLKADIGGKRKLLVFTLGKTQDILESGNVLAINLHREALSTIVNQIDILKLQVVEEMWANSKRISRSGVQKLKTRSLKLTSKQRIKMNTWLALNQKKISRNRFERAEHEQKLEYQRKIEEYKKDHATKSSEAKASPTSEGARTKLPKQTITKFNGSHTDWLRFWNIYEAEIDKCSDMEVVIRFAYLKDLLEPRVRAGIDGLLFSSEGYERAKNILRNKYGKTSEIVNA